MPTLRATVIYHGGKRYGVVFEYLHSTDFPSDSMLAIVIPCDSYDHASQVADAFNKRGNVDAE